MENPINNGCKPTERYGAVQAARMLGITRQHLKNYISRGLKYSLNKHTGYRVYKGIDIIKFYNTIA